MPRKQMMSWEGAPAYRWRKMHKGQVYRVTCQELGAAVWTEDGSYRLANEWWERKRGELAPKPAPEQEIMDCYRKMDLAEKIAEGEAARRMLAALEGRAVAQIMVMPSTLPLAEHTAEDRLAYVSKAASEMGGQVSNDKTVGHQLERFLTHEQARGKAPQTFADVSSKLRRLLKECEHLPPSLAVEQISGRTVSDVYAWLRSSSWAAKQQHLAFNHFRRLVRWLWGQELCHLPRNLDERTWSFEAGPKPIKTYSLAEVQSMLESIPERLKLYALLTLNCGMLGVDMASMTHAELDASAGTVTRKRSKTKARKTVPTVTYSLWPETLALLEKFPSTHPEFVLTSKEGTPLWRTWVEGGKVKRVDLVGVQWRRPRGNRPAIPLKALRSVAATLLEGHREYARFKVLFLGQAPQTVADRHYAAYSQELFDEAVMWLGAQILRQ